MIFRLTLLSLLPTLAQLSKLDVCGVQTVVKGNCFKSFNSIYCQSSCLSMNQDSPLRNNWLIPFVNLPVPHKSSFSLFSTLSGKLHHSLALLIHWIVHISHSSPTISWLQSQDHKPLFPACRTSCFLLLFLFLISPIHCHHPAVLHHYALIMDRSLRFIVAFFTLALKPSFSRSLSGLHSYLSVLSPP